MDPFILASHIRPPGDSKIVDVGCGCGIIPLILSLKHSDLNIIGIEIQEALFQFAKHNIMANRLECTIRILHNDIQNIQIQDIGGKADLIVSNPPYKKKNSGRLNPDAQKALARHEITLDIDMLFSCSNRLLKEHGRVYLIFPSERLSDLILTMARHNFSPDFIRFVHIKQNTAASRVILCAARRRNTNCTVFAPLYIYSSENKFTPEYVSMFKP